jgi:hypothetical protein
MLSAGFIAMTLTGAIRVPSKAVMLLSGDIIMGVT